MTKIYEIIDSSSDEMYYTIGLFLSLDEAIKIIEEEGVGLCDETLEDDGVTIKINEREIGKINWSGTGKRVYECYWTQNYETDEWEASLVLDSRNKPTNNRANNRTEKE